VRISQNPFAARHPTSKDVIGLLNAIKANNYLSVDVKARMSVGGWVSVIAIMCLQVGGDVQATNTGRQTQERPHTVVGPSWD